METIYRLKYTLYPDVDEDFTYDEEEYYEESSYPIHHKGTLWKICTKEEYCKLENYDEDETENFISDNCDFDYVAYMKDNTGIYFLVNTLEDFEEVEEDELKAIKEANSSEALECLEKIIDKGRINDGSCCHWRECLSKNKCNFNNDNLMCPDYIRANTIKQALLKAQENEKILDIIKEYQVDIWLLKQCDYENYIRIRKEAMVSVGQIVNENGVTIEDEITEEYFDLLKRYFDV